MRSLKGKLPPADGYVEGVVEMMLDATGHLGQPLMGERPLEWHASLFPVGRSGMKKIISGAWRVDSTGPMWVVSGPMGREHVHFEAPTAHRLPGEMKSFLDGFEGRGPVEPLLKAGFAHLQNSRYIPAPTASSHHDILTPLRAGK